MSVAVSADTSLAERSRKTARATLAEHIGLALTGFSILVAVVTLVYGLVLALGWYNQPFLGAFAYQTGMLFGAQPLTGSGWAAYDAGLLPDDQLLMVDGVSFRGVSKAGNLLNDLLAERNIGDTIQVTVFRPAHRLMPESSAMCGNFTEAGAECTFTLTLQRIPLVDFLGYFGLGFLVASIAIGLGLWVWSRRRHEGVARTLVALCMAGSVIFIARFDVTTTYRMAVLMKAGMVAVGGLLLQLSLMFPYPLPVVRRYPWLRAALLGASLLVFAVSLAIYSHPDPRISDTALLLTTIYLILCSAFLVYSMAIRRARSTSVIAREQATIILIGTLAPLVPGILWWVTNLIERTQGIGGLSFSTIYLQPPTLIVPFAMAYAILLQRAVDTDRLISDGIVLTLLGLMLVVGYLALTGAAYALTAGLIRPDNPVLIALTLFIISILFTPMRLRMERMVDNAFFRVRRQYDRELEQFAQSLTTTVQTVDVVDLVQRQLNATLAPQYSFVFLRNMVTGDYEAALDPNTGKMPTDVRFRPDSGLLRLLSSTRNILYFERDNIPPAELQSDRPRLAVLNTPVVARLHSMQRLNGFVALGPRRDGQPYSYEDLRFLEGLTNQAAAAFERAQVVLEAQRNERELQVLVQVSRSLNITMDFDTLLEFIFAQIDRVIPAPNFFIVLRDFKTEELYYAFYQESNERIPEKEGLRWAFGRDLMSEVVRTQRPYRTDNYVRDMQRRDSSDRIENINLRAWMGVPLTAGEGRTIGCLAMASTDANLTYTDDQERIFTNIADLAATALYKLRLLNESTELARQMQILNETSSRLATLFEDIDALLQNITESAVEILNCEAGSLLLIEDDSNTLVFRVVVGGPGDDLLGSRVPPGQGIVGTVVLTGHPVIVNDPPRDPRWYNEIQRDAQANNPNFITHSILAVPLTARGRVIGVLEVINKRDQTGFVESDANLLTAFASQAAVAIENANLFRLTDEALAERVKQLFNMQRIDQELNRTLDLQRVVDLTVDNAIRESEADAGALLLVNADKQGLRVVGCAGYPERVLRAGDYFDLDYGVMGRVYRAGEPVLILDPTSEPERAGVLPNARNVLAVPLVTGENVTGVLLLESTHANTFTPMTAEHIQGLAEHANTAITNAQLFQQLGEANNARIKFTSIVAHELKNPMASIKGYAELLMGGMTGPLNERQQEFVSVIRRNVVRMQQLVDDLRDITAQETGNLKLKMGVVNFHSVVLDSLRPQQRAFDEKEQRVTLNVPEDLPLVWADENRLVQILTNFLSNANKYTPKGGSVTITAHHSANDWDPDGAPEVVHCMVLDTGIGMTEDDLKKLFTPYWRSDNPQAQEQTGTGLGMSLTRGLIEAHGGKIWVESTPGVGTCFHFTIPLAPQDEIAARRKA